MESAQATGGGAPGRLPAPGPLAGASRRTDVSAVPADVNLALLVYPISLEPELNLVVYCIELGSGFAADGYSVYLTFTVGVAGSWGDNLTRHLRRGRAQLRRLWHQPHPPPYHRLLRGHRVGFRFQRARAWIWSDWLIYRLVICRRWYIIWTGQ